MSRRALDARSTMRAMDGLLRSVGEGIGGMVGGSIDFITATLGGMVASVSSALPAGALPVIGIAFLVAIGWLILKR